MIKRRTTMGLAAVAFAALVAGCGGGSPEIEGFAATGAAMAGASVTAKCVNGPDLTATTGTDGLFRLKLPGNNVLPCMVKAVSADGNTTLHSFAAGAGRLNVTPLTELTVSRALGVPAATEFAGFNAGKAATIAGQIDSAKAAIKTQVEALTNDTLRGDLFTSVFKVGDADDLVLDALKAELAAANRPLSALVASVAQGKPVVPRVKVFGDSLSDSGTFGVKFTVQGAAATGAGSADLWVDLVAKPLQVARFCPYFVSTGPSFTTRSECTNFAIGGGRVSSSSPALVGSTDPRSVPVQLQTAAQVYGGYDASDVLLVVGGGNDAADLAGAWIAASDPAKIPDFLALLAGVIGTDAANSLLANGAQGQVVAGMSFMETLAGKLGDAIHEHALGKGATKVLVMNMPDIALTPRFRAVLAGVAAQTSPQQAAQVEGVIQTWVNSFNSALAGRFVGSTKVAVLDFNTAFRAQVANPIANGFTNSSATACPVTGTDGSGLPTYNFQTCTAAALSAQPGKLSADWWTTYMFSDGFHPTPLAHSKAAEEASKVLTARGWN
jgi:phospholipase/lecithinase/hemolysin